MAQNYTKMWDAFLGGEYEGYDASKDYLEQTKDFYKTVLAPAFDLPGFGETDLAGAYAQFSEVDFETAERDFRSAIGDPYGTDDPFSWEKVSRYNTGDPAGVGRLQDLLEDQLYGQGKFLGGEAGADYGTATSKGVEAYSTGMRGEREGLTYEGLTGGAGLTSGTGGSVLRSGESTIVAEDVLIEAYKKAKTLGSDYRAGSELIERNLEGDLDDALTTYLDAIDDEKERWFSSVMGNVQTFKTLEMEDDLGECDGDDDCPEGASCKSGNCQVDYQTMTDEQLETQVGSEFYQDWSCGYGQKPDPDNPGECIDTDVYGTEVAGAKFSSDPACGIGELRNETTGVCEVRDDLGLQADDYGYLCDENDQGLKECGECGKTMTTCDDGSTTCDPGTCLETDDCGVYGGDGPSEVCWNGSMACPGECESQENEYGTQCVGNDDCGSGFRCDAGYCLEMIDDGCGPGEPAPDECGECGGPGAQELCWDQSLVCDLSECDIDPSTIEDECGVAGGPGREWTCWDGSMACSDADCPREDCKANEEWNSVTGKCEWTGTSGWQWDSSSCHYPWNSCSQGEKCGDNGRCYTPGKGGGGKGKGRKKKKGGTTGKGGELIGGR